MAGKLQNLGKWIPIAVDNKIRIIIVHDISDSATQSELESLLSGFSSENITLTSGYYGSPGAARNQGLSLANSKYVSFWDADDLPNPIQVYDSILNSKIDLFHNSANHYDVALSLYWNNIFFKKREH